MRASTKKTRVKADVDDLLPECDFTRAVRGKHAARSGKGTNVVVLDPDVSAVFRDSAAVNEALRALLPLLLRHRRSRRTNRASAQDGH
jgi:hypothetical protein